jgi:hypothetical protein
MKKFVIKYLPFILVYLIVISFGLYGTAIRQYALYKKYQDMKGIVISSTITLHGVYLCDIRLSNGLVGTINNGCTKVVEGDIWNNHIHHYNRLFGMSGYAFFIIPGEIRCFIENAINLLLIGIPIIIIFLYFLYNLYMTWVKKH